MKPLMLGMIAGMLLIVPPAFGESIFDDQAAPQPASETRPSSATNASSQDQPVTPAPVTNLATAPATDAAGAGPPPATMPAAPSTPPAQAYGSPTANPAAKIPAPTPADREEATALVNSIYKDDLSNAHTPGAKSDLARKMLQAAMETHDDPLGRFALLDKAAQVAIEAGDIPTFIDVNRATDDLYEFDALGARGDGLAILMKSVRAPDQQTELLEQLNRAADDAVGVDRYDLARRLAALAVGTADRIDDQSLTQKMLARSREIETIDAAFRQISGALATLKVRPNDPDANLKAGRFFCLVKGDWERGLPMLALGDDSALQPFVQRDLAGATDAEAQMTLGDEWWALAATKHGLTAENLQARAVTWYRRAEPQLTGLAKARVDQRINAVDSEPRITVKPTPPPPSQDSDDRQRQLAAGEVIRVTPRSDHGFEIGPVGRGTTLLLQYQSGKWKSWGNIATENPDSVKQGHPGQCRLAIADGSVPGQEATILAVVPPGTAQTPYVWVADRDVGLLVLRISGDVRKSNPDAHVTYRIKVVAGPQAFVGEQPDAPQPGQNRSQPALPADQTAPPASDTPNDGGGISGLDKPATQPSAVTQP
jgi:hypothetical protein